ncbi:MAG: hypothetical protein AAGB29_00845 [Planctomycetota bacterium]
MTQVDTQPANIDDNVELDDTHLLLVLKAIGVAFIVLVPVALLALPGVGILAKLWLAFLGANLLVWTGVVATAAIGAVRRGVAASAKPTAEVAEQPAPSLAKAA